MGNSFKILSIDGGGIRGVYPAHILRCIEERLQVNLYDTFDMIAGTSTGSIIAAGIAVGVAPRDIVDMYLEKGDRFIFSIPHSTKKAELPHMRQPGYQ